MINFLHGLQQLKTRLNGRKSVVSRSKTPQSKGLATSFSWAKTTKAITGIVGSSLLLLAAGPVLAQSVEDIAVGEVEYRVSCAACHGLGGKGDGYIAVFLRVIPADLTILTRINEGTFPADQLVEIIDGRTEIAVHGRRIMPIWGVRYLEEFAEFGGKQDNSALTRARIERLVAYLETIQQ